MVYNKEKYCNRAVQNNYLCMKCHLKRFRLIHKEKIRQERKIYRLNNKQKVYLWKKLYRETHQNSLKKDKREWYLKNRERILASRKIYNKLNKMKIQERSIASRINNPQKYKNHHYKSNFNITLDDYHNMLSTQNSCCAICGKHKSENKLNLSVDHCHKTGKIRGLLCSNCNFGIGNLKDSIINLQKAILYLQQHNTCDYEI